VLARRDRRGSGGHHRAQPGQVEEGPGRESPRRLAAGEPAEGRPGRRLTPGLASRHNVAVDLNAVRKTKIVATVGPASWEPDTLVEMIEAGVDVFRLNFSHADVARHTRTVNDIRAASRKADREVGILGDLPGPKLRVGHFPEGVVE